MLKERFFNDATSLIVTLISIFDALIQNRNIIMRSMLEMINQRSLVSTHFSKYLASVGHW